MTAQILASWAGLILALALSYVPKLGPWFNAQPSDVKVKVNGGMLLLIAAALFGLGCVGIAIAGVVVACNQAGAVSLGSVLLSALIGNQAGYLAFVRPFPSTNPPV
jgi:hypothetical protein